MVLFGFHIGPLFGKSLYTCALPVPVDKGTPKHKSKDHRDMVHHNCSMSPEAIREEVDALKTDFNNRIKQVLFNSMVTAYYMGFIPLCFAQVSETVALDYNTLKLVIHLV